MNLRRSTLPILFLATAAATSACASRATTAAGAGPASSATAASSSSAGSSSTATAAHPSSPASAAKPTTKTPTSQAPSKAAPADPDATSDSYAWKHPCDMDHLTIAVTEYKPGSHDGVRIVAVTNTGAKACGLAYYPSVTISDSTSMGGNSYPTRFVQARPPEGLGGQPYIPIYAGATKYAAIDLNPSKSATGASHAYDEIDVLASDFLPHAATSDFSAKDSPDNVNPAVHSPTVSLYGDTPAGAVRGLPISK